MNNYSRADGYGANDLTQRLIREHIVFLGTEVDQESANRICAELLLLEAEDPDYWYMRSPAPLNLREFKKGVQTESHNIRGGIALGKYTTRSVPAAGYIDGPESSRILIWKLGKEFLSREGKDWRKSF